MPNAIAESAFRSRVPLLALVSAALLLAVGLVAGLQATLAVMALPAVASAAWLVWRADPAYTLTAAFCLSPFAGNWQLLGLPSAVDPDRILLIAGILQILLRAPAVASRPPLRVVPAHAVLGLAVLYAVTSALAVGTLFSKAPLFRLIDAFGILPFLVFVAAPIAFRGERQRLILMVGIMGLGAYLSLTTLFEMIHLDALVFPKYILNPDVGLHVARGRGPFLDAVANGFALFVCATVCGVAALTQPRLRRPAAIIGALCVVGIVLCLERSVWIGSALAPAVALLSTRPLRRHFVPVARVMVVCVIVALVAIPGLSGKVSGRIGNTTYDRQNLAVAAVNMIGARPLTGFGWNRFSSDSKLYFRQSQNYPLQQNIAGLGVHNFLLTYGVDLGLVGVTLWAVGLLMGVATALASRGPPGLEAWRVALVAVVVVFCAVSNSVPPTLFPNLSLWLLAAVMFSGRYSEAWSRSQSGFPTRLQVAVPSRAPAAS